MTDIQTSPWGDVQHATELSQGVTLVETASHGGLHLTGEAARVIPLAVGRTFSNGPSWAEEDCELAIALTILHEAGLMPSKKLLGSTPAKMAETARRIAERHSRYEPAMKHLPSSLNHEPTPE
ncbi:MAG: hypothetical protein OXG35_33895 [Acidobacteria bacterium]|nr:hypothetical protein [Acidobacteriota bacterium]